MNNLKSVIRGGAAFLAATILFSTLLGRYQGALPAVLFFFGCMLLAAGYLYVRRRKTIGRIHLFHIAYSDETATNLPLGAKLLDNRNSPHNDWREYWPIRNYLLAQKLNENEYYGFLSPSFHLKTQLSYEAVRNFVKKAPADTDLFLFSPQPDWASFFLNPFEQGEFMDPGFMNTLQKFLDAIAYPKHALDAPMDSSNIVFSNYIVAKPAFWRAWLAINEKLFSICERPSGDMTLNALLTAETNYTGAVQRKVFVMERMASLILATDTTWKTVAYNPFSMIWSASPLRNHPIEAIACDGLKIAMAKHGFPEYRVSFEKMREPILQELARAYTTTTS